MAIVVAERVHQTSTTMGTGTIYLTGSVSGFKDFDDSIANGAETVFAITEEGGAWEVSRGFLTHGSPSSLTRVQVYDSSSGPGTPIDWPAGTRSVFCTFPAYLMNSVLDAAGSLSGVLLKAQNLNDLPSASTARTNLGLGNAAVKNQGPGNTLDADTVDGQHAAAFAVVGHDHSGVYAPSDHAHQALTTTAVAGGSSSNVVRVSGSGTVTAAANTDDPGNLLFLLAKGSDGTIYLPGAIVPFSGVAAGTKYFLGTAGALTSIGPTPTSSVANVPIGIGVATNSLFFHPQRPIGG